MTPTVYQKPEIRDANDNIIQQGAFGKNTALANATNDGWVDYVMNNLEFLNKLATAEIVPVTALPASGDTTKKYLVTTGTDAGKLFFWTGSAWQETADSVSRAEAAAQRASASQNAAAANQRTTATLAQDTVILAERIASMNSSILDAAEEVKEAARQAVESAGQAMSGTPEGYSKVSDVVIGLAGYKFVIDSKDNGLNLMEVKANE